ncbi:MAG: radical SAM protein [Thermoleophilia bacterium]
MSPPDSAYAVRGGPDTLWARGGPLLTTLDVELTERCDNRCVHCCINLPRQDRRARARELTTARLLAVLEEAAGLGALAVRFTGGEPLLRPDFAEIYVHARELGMRVVLFTNARGITEATASLLADIPPREPVEVTVYGMRRESYEAVTRAPGSYAQFRRGVDLLRAHAVPLVVKGTLLPETLAELDEFERWAAAISADGGQAGYVHYLDLRHRRDSPAADRRIATLRLTPEASLGVLAREGHLAAKLRADWLPQVAAPTDLLFTCGIGHRPCLDAYGVLQPCLSLRHPGATYDLAAGSLRDALGTVFPRLRSLRATGPDYLRRCARCFLAGVCEQCPAKSWAEHGTLDTPVDYLCEVTQAKARVIGWLAPGELPWEVVDWKERIA